MDSNPFAVGFVNTHQAHLLESQLHQYMLEDFLSNQNQNLGIFLTAMASVLDLIHVLLQWLGVPTSPLFRSLTTCETGNSEAFSHHRTRISQPWKQSTHVFVWLLVLLEFNFIIFTKSRKFRYCNMNFMFLSSSFVRFSLWTHNKVWRINNITISPLLYVVFSLWYCFYSCSCVL